MQCENAVLFRERAEAALAIELNGTRLSGREIRVYRCRSEQTGRPAQAGDATSSYAAAAARRVLDKNKRIAAAPTRKKRAAARAAAAAGPKEVQSRHSKAQRRVEADRRRSQAVKKHQITRDKQRKFRKSERK